MLQTYMLQWGYEQVSLAFDQNNVEMMGDSSPMVVWSDDQDCDSD